MVSAALMVDRRCATIRVVRFLMARRRSSAAYRQGGATDGASKVVRVTIEVKGLGTRGCPKVVVTCTTRSLSLSRALVASSSSRIGGSRNIALAMAILWRWPPLS